VVSLDFDFADRFNQVSRINEYSSSVGMVERSLSMGYGVCGLAKKGTIE
jgi:hypothetical protein